jgi:hypothetical protein
MSDIKPQADLSTRHAPEGHEESEVGIRGIFLFGVALIGLAVLVHFALGAFMKQFTRQEKQLAALRPLRFQEERGQFPTPRLQGNPAKDTQAFVATEREDLRSYGWADRKAKVGKVPIDRAIELLLQRRLPVHRDAGKTSQPRK